MKKILLISMVLFVASVACKKENVGGGGLCACSPVQVPSLNLVIKNSAGTDLLSDKTTGYYNKSKIEVNRRDAAGKVTAVDFAIRPPFAYGNEKFMYNQLYIPVSFLQTTDNLIYLKLGNGKTYKLKIVLNQDKYTLNKLLIDDQEAVKDNGNVAKYATVFYLTE